MEGTTGARSRQHDLGASIECSLAAAGIGAVCCADMKTLLGRFARAVRRIGGADDGAVEAGPAAAPGSPPNELERSLAEAAVDPAKRAAFQQLLLKSNLYAATPAPPPSDPSG